MAKEAERNEADDTDRNARSRRVCSAAEAKLQAAHRARRNRGRECGLDAGRARRSKDTTVIKGDVLDTIEEMIARLDQKLTAQMNEILHARGIPADRERLARPALSRLQLGDRRQSQDPGHERLEERALPESAALSGRAVGPEPAVQAGLRVRVRPARRRAVRLPDRRLLFQPSADRRAAAARPQQDRRRGACAVLRRRRADADGHGLLDRAVQSARHRQGVRHAGICGLEGPAGPGRLAICRPLHAARAWRACLTAQNRSRSRSSPSKRKPTGTPAKNMAG